MAEKVKIFAPEPLEDERIAQPFWTKYPKGKGSVLYSKYLPPNYFDAGVEYVAAEAADAIVLPNTFSNSSKKIREYVRQYADMGEKLNKSVFVFCLGDLNDRVKFDSRVYVLRQSVYRSSMRPQDIVIPTLTEDNAKAGITVRHKQPVPLVSFVGQGDYQTLAQQVKYYLKVFWGQVKASANPVLQARIIGVYWRKKMIHACEQSEMIDKDFIVRKSFSGAHRTIELDPAQAREEYLNSIINSDFVLAPKGDGNYSNRFLKTLCMGRIPVFLDTDAVLPLEGYVDYTRCVVRVPMDKVTDTPNLVRQWYDAKSNVEWEAAQHDARTLFETRLRIDAFYEFFFTTVLKQLPPRPAAA